MEYLKNDILSNALALANEIMDNCLNLNSLRRSKKVYNTPLAQLSTYRIFLNFYKGVKPNTLCFILSSKAEQIKTNP